MPNPRDNDDEDFIEGEIAQYKIGFQYCNCTASLSSIGEPGGNDMNCVFAIEPITNSHTTAIYAYDDCDSPAPPTVGLMSAINYDGDVVAIIDLVRPEVAKLVNEAKEGAIKFCVRTDVNENIDGEQLSINFVKAFITVNIFLDGNFELDVAVDENTELSEQVVDAFEKYYSVFAHQCDPVTALNTNAVIYQGDTLGVCIRTIFYDTWIEQVNTITLYQIDPSGGPDTTTTPVSDGTPNVITDYDCNLDDQRKCIVRTLMLSKFFVNQQELVNVVGEVELLIRVGPQFNRGRSLSIDSTDRKLQSGFKSKFDLDVGLGNGNEYTSLGYNNELSSSKSLTSNRMFYVAMSLCGWISYLLVN